MPKGGNEPTHVHGCALAAKDRDAEVRTQIGDLHGSLTARSSKMGLERSRAIVRPRQHRASNRRRPCISVRTTVVEFLGDEATASLESLKVKWLPIADNDGETGIVAAHFTTPRGVVVLD